MLRGRPSDRTTCRSLLPPSEGGAFPPKDGSRARSDDGARGTELGHRTPRAPGTERTRHGTTPGGREQRKGDESFWGQCPESPRSGVRNLEEKNHSKKGGKHGNRPKEENNEADENHDSPPKNIQKLRHSTAQQVSPREAPRLTTGPLKGVPAQQPLQDQAEDTDMGFGKKVHSKAPKCEKQRKSTYTSTLQQVSSGRLLGLTGLNW